MTQTDSSFLPDSTFLPFGFQYYRSPTPFRDQWEHDLQNIAAKGFNCVKYWVQWRAVGCSLLEGGARIYKRDIGRSSARRAWLAAPCQRGRRSNSCRFVRRERWEELVVRPQLGETSEETEIALPSACAYAQSWFEQGKDAVRLDPTRCDRLAAMLEAGDIQVYELHGVEKR